MTDHRDSPSVRKRSRRRRSSRGPGYSVLRGLVVLAVVAFAGWQAIRAYNGVPLRDYATAYAEIPDPGNLRSHDQVRIGGVRVGQVVSITTTDRGQARMKLQIEPSTGAVPVDTQISIRAAGLLGARFVELLPGRSTTPLTEEDTIMGGPDAKTYGVPEALDVLDARTRAGLSTTFDELSVALLGNGRALNDGFRAAAPAQRQFQSIAKEILRRPGAAERLLPSMDSMFAPLANSRAEWSKLFAPASTAVRPFADEPAAVRASLTAAPPALSAVRTGFGRGRTLLAATRRLSSALRTTLPPAPRALRSTAALLGESPVPLRRAALLLEHTRPAIPDVLRVAAKLSPVLAPTAEALRSVIPLNERVAQYGCDITNFGAVFRSVTGFGVPAAGRPAGEFRLSVALPPKETLQLSGDGESGFDPYSDPCKFIGPKSTIEPTRPAPKAP